ncbi:MAG: response regulator [Clostridia bacterium]|jgi:DNA-binding NarL/FixJ family response regulator|nr:response regulator [Clostridia bacterium]
MKKIKVLIVDDSIFSRTLLKDALQSGGCEVVGEVESIDNMMETYRENKPDVVTMDLAMPGADGFECSKTLLAYDPGAKIILVSSMKDEDTEAEARLLGLAGYLQKPIEQDTLLRVIDNVLSPDKLYQKLDAYAPDAFRDALNQTIARMTRTTVVFVDKEQPDKNLSNGIAVVIGITGRCPGSLIFDLSALAAEDLMQTVLKREPQSREEVIPVVAEIANVVAGLGCSMLNKKEKLFGLRVTPPNVFYGASTEIVSPAVKLEHVYAKTSFGEIRLSFGFKKGTIMWM